MRDLKPTIFCTVPRLLNRVYAKVNSRLYSDSSDLKEINKQIIFYTKVTANLDKAPFYKKFLFKWAFANKEQEVLK